jgi:hypothetical protein
MQLEYTSFWIPSSANPAKHGTASLTINVLPRDTDAAQLRARIEQLHLQHQLWGGAVAIQAPNQRELVRCKYCQQLGHFGDGCPRYAGFAVRLLFKQPLPFAAMRALQPQLGARDGYLGASTDEHAPHRKVSLLFNGDSDDDATLQPVLVKMTAVLPALIDKLHEAPSVVNPKDRLRECSKCNSRSRAHICPFEDRRPPPRAVQANAAPPAAGAASGLGAGLPSRPPARMQTAPDSMCKSWRQSKTCPRMAQGRACSFQHPTDHQPPPLQPCYELRDHGRCNRVACRFAHSPTQPAAQPAIGQQPAAPESKQAEEDGSGAAPPTRAAPPAAAAAAAADDARLQRRPSASSKKRSLAEAQQTPAAAAASLAHSNSWSALVENADEDEVRANEERAATYGRPPTRGRPASPPPRAAPVSSLAALASPAKRQALATRSASTGGGAPAKATSVSPSSRRR